MTCLPALGPVWFCVCLPVILRASSCRTEAITWRESSSSKRTHNRINIYSGCILEQITEILLISDLKWHIREDHLSQSWKRCYFCLKYGTCFNYFKRTGSERIPLLQQDGCPPRCSVLLALERPAECLVSSGSLRFHTRMQCRRWSCR